MYSRAEGTFTGYKDIRLFYQRWSPPHPVANLIITHGHGEHSECYLRVVQALEGQNISIFAWDWRGHGKSEGKRGFANDFSEYCYDFESFISHLDKSNAFQGKPVSLLAHSMGGLIQLQSIIAHPEWKFSCQVLSSPFLGLALQVPLIKDLAAQALVHLMPQMTLPTGVINQYLTRDPAIAQEFDQDILRHDKMSAGLYLSAIKTQEYVQSNVDKISLKTFLQISDGDQVASSEKNKQFYSALRCEKEMKIYPGYKHELYNDLDREVPLSDMSLFLEKNKI